MKPCRFSIAILSAGLLMLCLYPACGCSKRGRLNTVAVKGKVTYKGEPITRGEVIFQPVNAEQGRPARAKIQPDGSYVARTTKDNPGLVPGHYKLAVAPYTPPPVSKHPPAEAAIRPRENPVIPERYTSPERSGLSTVVSEKDRSKEVNLELD